MNQPLIGTLNLSVTMSAPSPGPLATALLGALMSSGKAGAKPSEPEGAVPATPSGDLLTPPAIGEYWAGQGGIYSGIQQDQDGQLYHKIFADSDVGSFAWGEYGTETGTTNKVNGVLNTTTLRDTEGSFPAAEAASNYTADGHHDFVLPSIAELNHAWAFIPDSFAKEAYWSSSQRSANYAFYMYFDVGYQDIFVKLNELRVRPVRRLPIR